MARTLTCLGWLVSLICPVTLTTHEVAMAAGDLDQRCSMEAAAAELAQQIDRDAVSTTASCPGNPTGDEDYVQLAQLKVQLAPWSPDMLRSLRLADQTAGGLHIYADWPRETRFDPFAPGVGFGATPSGPRRGVTAMIAVILDPLEDPVSSTTCEGNPATATDTATRVAPTRPAGDMCLTAELASGQLGPHAAFPLSLGYPIPAVLDKQQQTAAADVKAPAARPVQHATTGKATQHGRSIEPYRPRGDCDRLHGPDHVAFQWRSVQGRSLVLMPVTHGNPQAALPDSIRFGDLFASHSVLPATVAQSREVEPASPAVVASEPSRSPQKIDIERRRNHDSNGGRGISVSELFWFLPLEQLEQWTQQLRGVTPPADGHRVLPIHFRNTDEGPRELPMIELPPMPRVPVERLTQEAWEWSKSRVGRFAEAFDLQQWALRAAAVSRELDVRLCGTPLGFIKYDLTRSMQTAYADARRAAIADASVTLAEEIPVRNASSVTIQGASSDATRGNLVAGMSQLQAELLYSAAEGSERLAHLLYRCSIWLSDRAYQLEGHAYQARSNAHDARLE